MFLVPLDRSDIATTYGAGSLKKEVDFMSNFFYNLGLHGGGLLYERISDLGASPALFIVPEWEHQRKTAHMG
jgi:hypothetical protein